MKIYTRKGDNGKTKLGNGKHIEKNNPIVHAYGTIDELNSWIGVLYEHLIIQKKYDNTRKNLDKIQNNLFVIGAELANLKQINETARNTLNINEIELEIWIDEMATALPKQRYFILPRGNQYISFCHLARTVCRRAERELVACKSDYYIQPPILKYINRLSDAIFILARYIAKCNEIDETFWIPKK